MRIASSPLAAVEISKFRRAKYVLKYLDMLPSSSTISILVFPFDSTITPKARHAPTHSRQVGYQTANRYLKLEAQASLLGCPPGTRNRAIRCAPKSLLV